MFLFVFSSSRRHTRCALVTGVQTCALPIFARAILDFVAHEGLPVIGSLGKPFLGGFITDQHCHAANKMRMIHAAGYGEIAIAYSDSRADLPLLHAASHPVVVNPKESRSEEHTSELQSLMLISYSVFCLKKKNIFSYYYA